MKKTTISFVLCALLFFGAVYASQIHTIRHTIGYIGAGPYANNLTGDNLRLMRSGSENWEGDYLLGSYLDPAHGRFTFPVYSSSDRVRISGASYSSCGEGFTGRMLAGRAESELFGPVRFDDVYICLPNDAGQLGATSSARLGGSITSPMIGTKVVDVELGSTLFDIEGEDFRRLKVIGLATSQNFETFDDEQLSEVRVFGNVSKTELRTLMQRNVQTLTRNLTGDIPSQGVITNLSSDTWATSGVSGVSLQNNTVRYFRSTATIGMVPRVNIQGSNLSGNKTLVVEGSDVYISGNITGDGILGIISLQRNGRGGNIYINRTATDVHAFLYADRSIMSARMNGTNFEILSGSDHEERLFNQLYIKGVLFSENTIGGANNAPYTCPFYISNTCNLSEAAKYDLNYLRRYYIAEDEDGNEAATGAQAIGILGREGELARFPVILEYDNRITRTPPPLFSR